MSKRPATFTEANCWVHFAPARFARYFPSIRSVWQAGDGRIWVEAREATGLDLPEYARWELAERSTGEPVLPCGCRVQVRYLARDRVTVCTFSNQTTGFRMRLRISGELMLTASAPSHMHEAVCAHPHDETTVREQLERTLAGVRARRVTVRDA